MELQLMTLGIKPTVKSKRNSLIILREYITKAIFTQSAISHLHNIALSMSATVNQPWVV